MEPDFILRKNIERFRHLLAGGSLSTLQAQVVTDLLQKEVEALAAWEQAARIPGPRVPQ